MPPLNESVVFSIQEHYEFVNGKWTVVFGLFADQKQPDSADHTAYQLFCSDGFFIEQNPYEQQDAADHQIAD